MQKKKRPSRKYLILSILSFLTFLVVWELITDGFRLVKPYALPSPVRVFETFIRKLYSASPDGSTLLVHVLASLEVTVTGFVMGAVIGVPLGICMAWYKKVDLLVGPLFDLVRPIPPIGWVPIMMLMMGIGLKAKAAVIFIAAIIPCIINAYSGIKQTNPVHLWVGRTFGASNFQMLTQVAIPTALPMIFTGLKVSLGVAWMTLVAAELVAATKGLGYMLQIARSIGRADIIVMGMLVIAGVGAMLSYLLQLLENRFVKGYKVK